MRRSVIRPHTRRTGGFAPAAFVLAAVLLPATVRAATISANPALTGSVPVTPAAALTQPRPLKILPLGDSITWGFENDHSQSGGYRSRLYDRMRRDGRAVQYLGSVTDRYSTTLINARQTRHEGHGGYTISQITNNLTGNDGSQYNNGGRWLTGTGTRPAIDPDVILLHIGTNDVLRRTIPTRETLRSRLDTLINRLTSLEPQAYLLVAGIVPIDDDTTRNNLVKAYNSTIRNTIVPKYAGLGKKVRFVDQYPRFVSSSGAVLDARLPDNVHPDEIGYGYIADGWFSALKSLPVYRPAGTALVSSDGFDVASSEALPEPTALTAAAGALMVLLLKWRGHRTAHGFVPCSAA